jgi:hypothetical protein
MGGFAERRIIPNSPEFLEGGSGVLDGRFSLPRELTQVDGSLSDFKGGFASWIDAETFCEPAQEGTASTVAEAES